MGRMRPGDRARLFELRCRSKLGLTELTTEEQQFCERMYREHPDEYGQDEEAVFNKTAASIGSDTRVGDGSTAPDFDRPDPPGRVHVRTIGDLVYWVFQQSPVRFEILVRIVGQDGGGAWVRHQSRGHRCRGARRKWRKLDTALRYLDQLQEQHERRRRRLEEAADSAEGRETRR